MNELVARSRLATIIGLAAVISACGAGLGGPTASPVTGGGTLSIGYEGDIFTFDPAIGYDYISWPAERLLFETLVTYDEGTNLVPRLAEEMPTVSDDGLTYTFRIRDGVSFVKGDGTVLREMTAADVIYSLNRILDPDLTPSPSPVGGTFFAVIEGAAEVLDGSVETASGIRAVDERTVEITITQPDVTFLNVLAMPFGSVLPADLAGEDTAAFSADPVGTGPYYLAEYTSGQGARFVRNPHYWGDPAPTAEIDFQVGVDTNTQLQRAQAGELDIMGDTIPAGSVDEVVGNPEYEDRLITEATIQFQFLALDAGNADSPLGDVQVRQAISHAVDKENVIQVVRRGEVADCIFPPRLPGHNPDCGPYDYDPDRARELLADAGYAEGFSTTLYTDTSSDSTAVAQAVQEDLAAVGIEVELITQEFDVLYGTILEPHAAPIVYIGWIQDFPDPADFYDPILSCAAIEAGFNLSWACNEGADAIAVEAKGMTDEAARLEAYQEVEQLVMEEAFVVPLFFPVLQQLASERVENPHFHPVWTLDLAAYRLSE